MKAVIDTNVLVSGLVNPFGAPGEIIDLVFSGQLEPLYDDRIIFEYTAVLLRPKFSFPPEIIAELLESVRVVGCSVVPQHCILALPDDNDRAFVECARECDPPILITGNIRHFPAPVVCGIEVLTPREYLEKYLDR